MTPIINIDTTVIQSLPFSKRLTKWMCFLQSVCYPIKWLYNNVLTGYMGGTVTSNWLFGDTYNLGQQVVFNYGVWESTLNGNIYNSPNTPIYSISGIYAIGFVVLYKSIYYQCNTTISSGEIFTPAHWTALIQAPWILVNNSFIGATERATYNGRYLSLTWALNRHFQTIFRQPPYPAPYGGGSLFSDIYITNYEPAITSFVSFTTEEYSSDSFTDGSAETAVYTVNVDDTGTTYVFEIYIPTAVYIAIGNNTTIPNPIANSIINQFVTPIVPAGIGWTINTY